MARLNVPPLTARAAQSPREGSGAPPKDRPALPPENIFGHTKKLAFLLDHVAARRRGTNGRLRVLDFGCGSGEAVSRYLIGEGVDYVGVDDYEPCLAYARARFGGPHATFLSEPPRGAPFDVIVYADVLEHLADPVAVLRAHADLLRDDGTLAGSIPNGYGPYEMEAQLDLALRVSPRIHAAAEMARRVRRLLRGHSQPSAPALEPPYNHGSPHVQFFTRAALEATLREGGFCIERFSHGCFAGAAISGYFLRQPRLLAANVQVADALPDWAVSTWYFTARKQ